MPEYKLRTIKDIIDKVPTDRIEECMKELTVLLVQASGMSALMSEAIRVATPEHPNLRTSWVFPEEITWNDDRQGIIQNNFQLGDEVLTVKTTRGTPE